MISRRDWYEFPIISSTEIQWNKYKALLFASKIFWCECHLLDNITNRNWRTKYIGRNMFTFCKKLKATKIDIKDWFKNNLGIFMISSLKTLKRLIMWNKDFPSTLATIYLILKWLGCLNKEKRLFNQKYWDKFRRKEWLINGDWNSNFFECRAMITRKKKVVIKLKDESTIWIDDQNTIVENLFLTISNDSNMLIVPIEH